MDRRTRWLLGVAVLQVLAGLGIATTGARDPAEPRYATVAQTTSSTSAGATPQSDSAAVDHPAAPAQATLTTGTPLHPPRPGAAVSQAGPTTTTGRGPPTTTKGTPAPTTTTTASPSPGGCPDPRTCDRYRYTDGPNAKGWRIVNGKATIPFWINSTPPKGSTLTAEQIERGLIRGTQAWGAASPVLDFQYKGTTTREPVPGDGFTDLAFGSDVQTRKDRDGFIGEADILRNSPALVSDNWVSAPCEQRDGSCTGIGGNRNVAEELMTHEPGHLLGLADLIDDADKGLTMYSYVYPGERHKQTLGLGDKRAVEKLYPCACTTPPVYVP